jgi:hypothetical protein
LQSSKIASIHLPLRFPTGAGSNEVDPVFFGDFSDILQESISRCFGHTCITTGIEDFVYLLTFERADRECDPGYVPFDFVVFCHVTEFVRTLQERLQCIMQGDIGKLPRVKTLRGDQRTYVHSGLGRYMPHRIHRMPPSEISIQQVDAIASPPGRATSTSTLLCLLAGAFKRKVLLWNDAEKYPDLSKVMDMFDRIDRHGFSWDAIDVDPSDPEKWEYTG